MIRYIIFFALFIAIWIINGRWIAHAMRQNIISEIFMHSGLGLFFTMLTFELTIGNTGLVGHLHIQPLKITGYILYIPASLLIASSLIALHKYGNPHSEDITDTSTIVENGIYSIIRQPMTLGMAIFSIALILIFPSIPNLIAQTIAFASFLISALTETKFNIEKFGSTYIDYMHRVPLWNIIKGLRYLSKQRSKS